MLPHHLILGLSSRTTESRNVGLLLPRQLCCQLNFNSRLASKYSTGQKVGHQVYTCSIYKRQKKRNNYTVCYFNETTQQEEYGEIKYFCEASDSRVALVEQFNVDHLRCFTHTDSAMVVKHIVPISKSNKIHIIQMSAIRFKVIRVCDYLCLRPNRYEVHL